MFIGILNNSKTKMNQTNKKQKTSLTLQCKEGKTKHSQIQNSIPVG